MASGNDVVSQPCTVARGMRKLPSYAWPPQVYEVQSSSRASSGSAAPEKPMASAQPALVTVPGGSSLDAA
ncbi:hypothetical protein ACRAWF_04910 [Streptomyces sp. L7]